MDDVSVTSNHPTLLGLALGRRACRRGRCSRALRAGIDDDRPPWDRVRHPFGDSAA